MYKPIADEAQLWIKTKEIKVLRELLEPYFHLSIKNRVLPEGVGESGEIKTVKEEMGKKSNVVLR